jgi:RNA methyltransferase, TrmH family
LTKAELQGLRSLREKKNREARGLFVVEGEKIVSELLAENFPLLEIYTTIDPSHWNLARLTSCGHLTTTAAATGQAAALAQEAHKGRIVRISEAEMARASHFPTPSTVLAVGKIERRALSPHALEHGFTLALDGIQDAGNVGTLLRVADWFAVDRVIVSPDCADIFHQKVINASMGSFARVAVHTADVSDVLATLRSDSAATPILGCDLEGDDVHALPPLRDAVIVIGSEGRGLSPVVAAQLTRRITIPRYGRAESLNAAIAGAIVCDQLRGGRPPCRPK